MPNIYIFKQGIDNLLTPTDLEKNDTYRCSRRHPQFLHNDRSENIFIY